MNFSSDPINTLENLIAKNKTKSLSIYLVIVMAVLVFIALLPVIKIDISSQSRGIIRSKTDNVPVTAIVSGRISWLALKNNAVVRRHAYQNRKRRLNHRKNYAKRSIKHAYSTASRCNRCFER